MAFTVEDGTGLAGANSYMSVQEFKDYHKERGTDISALGGTADLEKLLVRATDYIEQNWGLRFAGTREFETQVLSFPRLYLCTRDGFSVLGIPDKLKWAQAEYAMEVFNQELFVTPQVDAGGTVIRTREKVGPIETETEYAASSSTSAQTTVRAIPKADSWLREYVFPGGVIYRG